MLFNGKRLAGPNVEILVLPRTNEAGEQEDIVFKAQAVLDYKPFEQLCPAPKIPTRLERGKRYPTEDTEAPEYKQALKDYNTRRYHWLILESLRVTPNLEWEKVDYSRSETWKCYEEELKESGFSQSEINMIVNLVMSVNSLDDDKLKQARERFLLGRGGKEDSTSPGSEQNSTESGVPVNGSV